MLPISRSAESPTSVRGATPSSRHSVAASPLGIVVVNRFYLADSPQAASRQCASSSNRAGQTFSAGISAGSGGIVIQAR